MVVNKWLAYFDTASLQLDALDLLQGVCHCVCIPVQAQHDVVMEDKPTPLSLSPMHLTPEMGSPGLQHGLRGGSIQAGHYKVCLWVFKVALNQGSL